MRTNISESLTVITPSPSRSPCSIIVSFTDEIPSAQRKSSKPSAISTVPLLSISPSGIALVALQYDSLSSSMSAPLNAECHTSTITPLPFTKKYCGIKGAFSVTVCHTSSQTIIGKLYPFCSAMDRAASTVLVASTFKSANTPYSGCSLAICCKRRSCAADSVFHVAQYITTDTEYSENIEC